MKNKVGFIEIDDSVTDPFADKVHMVQEDSSEEITENQRELEFLI